MENWTEEKKQEIYKLAVNKWGVQEQVAMLAEESSELSAEANHFRRGRCGSLNSLAEEIANTIIMIDQLSYIFPNIEELINTHITEKLDKLERILVFPDECVEEEIEQ